jgi:hypothetical protein
MRLNLAALPFSQENKARRINLRLAFLNFPKKRPKINKAFGFCGTKGFDI